MTLPSVTTILKYYSDFSRVPEDVLQAACERGSKVHAACAATALGVYCPALPEELQGYHLSFMMWLDCYVDEVVLVEPELVSAALGYRGHPDLLVRIMGDKGLTIVDLKTPAGLVKTWAPSTPAQRSMVTQLCKTKDYSLEMLVQDFELAHLDNADNEQAQAMIDFLKGLH